MELPEHIQKLLDFEFKDEPEYNYKQYILIRTDEEFSRGKLMVHAAHNSCTALLYEFQRGKGVWEDHPRIMQWFNSGKCQAKIILQVKNEKELKKWVAKVHEFNKSCVFNIPIAIIKDGGAYEVDTDTIIGCAIGPLLPSEAKDLGLKRLRLFK